MFEEKPRCEHEADIVIRQKQKTPQGAGLGGVTVQSETGLLQLVGGDGGIRTLDAGFARMLP